MSHGTDAVRLESVEHAQETSALQRRLPNATGFDWRWSKHKIVSYKFLTFTLFIKAIRKG